MAVSVAVAIATAVEVAVVAVVVVEEGQWYGGRRAVHCRDSRGLRRRFLFWASEGLLCGMHRDHRDRAHFEGSRVVLAGGFR